MPDLVALDLPALVDKAGYPGTRIVPATSWLLSLLALKLTRTRRVSHVDDLLLSDPAAALLAGLATLPKKSALTDYSYRTSHDHQRGFLAALDRKMIAAGWPPPRRRSSTWTSTPSCTGAPTPPWRSTTCPPAPSAPAPCSPSSPRTAAPTTSSTPTPTCPRPPRTGRSSPSATTGNPSAGTTRTCWSWTRSVTTQPVLAELDARGVGFLTLRMRSPALLRQINTLNPGDYKTITLDRSGPHNRPRVHESTVALSNYPGTVRQFIVTGLGRDAPTVIITNDTTSTARQLITRYARRMTIEQRLAEIIRAFHADALSSAVNLNVDLDIILCVLAQALLAALRARLPGYAAVTPDVLQRRFLETPGQIITTDDAITVRLDRRAYTPVLRQAALPEIPVPWWGDRTLRYEFA